MNVDNKLANKLIQKILETVDSFDFEDKIKDHVVFQVFGFLFTKMIRDIVKIMTKKEKDRFLNTCLKAVEEIINLKCEQND